MADVFGYVGVKGSGKTYRRDLAMQAYAYAVALDFKSELIDMCGDLLGFPVPKTEAEYERFKETIVGFSIDGDGFNDSAAMLAKYPNAMTGRKLLQRMGTDVVRKRAPDYWVDALLAKAKGCLAADTSVFCADVRFRNEVQALHALEGIAPVTFIFCDYHSPRYCAHDKHPSEELAQVLLGMGLKDGDTITKEHFEEAWRKI